ncbi:LOW QUALITY PROTEIN: DNA transposase [Frankliniella fusca]|uniref:DNA transposase n=1 Tax=Frankliniella fusca TaxID=407009 RepID=A0AAE1LGV7_9NEOP|nr:LOW QUALITY PROTEIN: DNA transposase [Frankliniella fusca]
MREEQPSAIQEPCPNRSPCYTQAEIMRMPVVIYLPMEPVRAESPTSETTEVMSGRMSVIYEETSDNENLAPRANSQQAVVEAKQGSFDSTTANYPSGSEQGSPLSKQVKRVTPQKRHFGELTENDMISPKRGRLSYELSKETVDGYRLKIKTLNQKLRRAQKKINTLQALLTHLENDRYIERDVATLIKNTFQGPARDLLDRMIFATEKQPYSKELTRFALTLNFHSPAAYEYVRSTFMKCLPHPKTISKLYEVINGEPGFNMEALDAIKIAVDEAKASGKKEQVCALMCDEMAIRKQAQWTGQSVVGWSTCTKGPLKDNAPLAKEAWVFMVVAVNGSWKMPVGYFFMNSMGGVARSNILKQCLQHLHETGVTIASLTFDGNAANLTMTECLGANLEPLSANWQPWFKHPCTDAKVFIVLDAAHMIKLWRNILGNDNVKLFDSNNREIKWEFLVRLHEFQDREGLLAGTKVRKRHINFQTNKMKVRLAAQLLSLSTSDALLYLSKKQIPGFSGSEATSEYIRVADMENYHLLKKLCEEGKKYILGLKVVAYDSEVKRWCAPVPILQSPCFTGFLGFLTGIDTALSVFETYIQTDILKFLPMYKLSQDHLETFFCAVKSRGGWNNNPNVKQFMAAYKRLLVQVQLGAKHKQLNTHDVTEVDCEPDDQLLADDDRLIADHDPYAPLQSLSALSPYVTDVVEYISGFVTIRKSALCCVQCCFIWKYNKLRPPQNKEQGRLIKKIALRKAIPVYINKIKARITSSIFSALDKDHDYCNDTLDTHRSLLMSSIIKKYLVIRIYHDIKRLNESVIKKNIRHTMTKTVIFQGQ